MKILSIDTSTQCASCALVDDHRVLGEITFNYKKQHSVLMMDMIDSLLKTCGTKIKDIDAFVVSEGPGSFTGLRIGMATIKGLAHGGNKPFVSVSSLHSLAMNIQGTEGIVCSIIDALRDHVYFGIYRFDSNNNLEILHDVSRESFDDLLEILKSYDEKVTFIGDCTDKFKERIMDAQFKIAPHCNNLVRASSLAFVGMDKIEKEGMDNLYNSIPIYLIKPQAEREYEERQKKEK